MDTYRHDAMVLWEQCVILIVIRAARLVKWKIWTIHKSMFLYRSFSQGLKKRVIKWNKKPNNIFKLQGWSPRYLWFLVLIFDEIHAHACYYLKRLHTKFNLPKFNGKISFGCCKSKTCWNLYTQYMKWHKDDSTKNCNFIDPIRWSQPTFKLRYIIMLFF